VYNSSVLVCFGGVVVAAAVFAIGNQAVIPENQLSQVGKEIGETAHVERWNNTLRQRIGRFVRKTLSFSKSMLMYIACLDLFLHRYNLERVTLLR
jgi:hypothetical protein